MNIWSQLPIPFFVLAPMDDVTDTVFRQVIAECAPPHLFYTEFVNADGLQSSGRDRVIKKLQVSAQSERPIIAQIWGLQPDNFYKTAQELVEMGFDGVDLNMGCPVRVVTRKGACSALIDNETLAGELIAATKDGVAGQIPVSVKTRIGFNRIETERWMSFLLKQDISALIVHGRTAKEQSKVPNHWEEIAKVPALRDELAPSTVVVGNGDIMSWQDGHELATTHELDGVMIGRGIFSNPFIFDTTNTAASPRRLLEVFLRHLELFEQTWETDRTSLPLKKFAKTYIREFEGSSEVRTQLMQANSVPDMRQIIEQTHDKLV